MLKVHSLRDANSSPIGIEPKKTLLAPCPVTLQAVLKPSVDLAMDSFPVNGDGLDHFDYFLLPLPCNTLLGVEVRLVISCATPATPVVHYRVIIRGVEYWRIEEIRPI